MFSTTDRYGGQFEEGLGKLAGLDHDVVALAGLAVAIDERQLAADDCRGIFARQFQRSGDHRGGRGLAMRTGDADALLVQAAHIAQQNAALNGGDAIGGCCVQLHIVLGDGCRVDHHIRADDVVCIVTDRHFDSHLPFVADDAAVQHIAARDLVAFCSEDLNERIHSAAAAADEVDFLYVVQQVLGIIGIHEHIRQPPIKQLRTALYSCSYSG